MHATFGRRSSDNRDENMNYSNYFEIGFNGYAFIFEFAMVTSSGAGRCVSRVVMNPPDAEQFSELLAEAVDQHINRYGPIKRVAVQDSNRTQ